MVQAGIIIFYAVIGLFTLVEKGMGGGEGIMIMGGRMFACICAVLYFGTYTGGMSRAELAAQLDGGEDPGLPGKIGFLVRRVLLWGSLPAAAWKFYNLQIWDGIMLLGCPVWVTWLRLELRRVDVENGTLKPGLTWSMLTALFAVVLAVSFAATVSDHAGPVIHVGRDYVRLYPLITMLCIPPVLLFGMLSGFGGRKEQ